MKAGILYGNNDVRYGDIDSPAVNASDVLVKVAYCGICGSDLPRVFQGTSKCYPNVLGHEFSGIVEAVGSSVQSCKPGDKVTGVPLIPCNECEKCAEGNYALCDNYDFIGSRRFGAFAEYISVPQDNVFVLKQDVDLRTASLFEPAAVAIHGIDLAGDMSGKNVAVVGGGTIGLLLAQVAVAKGAANVVVFGRRDERLIIAASVGLDKVVNISQAGWRAKMTSDYDIVDFDYVFEVAGTGATILQSLDLATSKGLVCFVGTPKKDVLFSVPEWEQINRKELTLVGSWMSYGSPWPGKEWNAALELFSSGQLVFSDEMIHAVYELSEITEAFGQFYPDNKALGKVLVKCN